MKSYQRLHLFTGPNIISGIDSQAMKHMMVELSLSLNVFGNPLSSVPRFDSQGNILRVIPRMAPIKRENPTSKK